jgi:Tfp pilus assembly protein FimV
VTGACGLAAMPASALELGTVRVESTLGQPLRASIAYALNPNEQLYDFCIYLRPGTTDGVIPNVSRARISLTPGEIVVTGNVVVRDPLLNLRVAVDCPYTPHLAREYTLIVDPALPATTNAMLAETDSGASPSAADTAGGGQERTSPKPAVRPAGPTVTATADTPISMNTEYRVLNGDTISLIASRIEGRTVGLWPAINALVAANPDAFIDGDADRLKSGSLIFVPDLAASGSDTRPVAPVVQREPVSVPAELPVPAPLEVVDETLTIAEPVAPTPAPEPVVETPVETPVAAVAAAETAAAVPQPAEDIAVGDVVTDASIDTIETEEELRPGDVVVTPRASVPVVSSDTSSAEEGGSWSVLTWLGGGALALLLGLAVFGRRLRDRFGSRPIGPAEMPAPVQEEEPTQANPVIDDVDFQFNDAVDAEEISLDADLGAGTGLQDGAEMDVAQDYGFSADTQASGDLDLEITEEALAEPQRADTDIIGPSHRVEESSILEAEFAPDDEEYDMSMIVDATKQSIGEDDLTAKDMMAVAISPEDDDGQYSVSDGTLNDEVDLHILEQDYEEEFTQTQALNKEIEEAAAELARTMEEAERAEAPVADGGLDPTVEMQSTADGTARMPSMAADSETTAELTANIPMDVNAENDDLVDDDITSKMVAAGSDVTVEMQVESGKVDTKKKD